ncbi:hypothetical protein KIW84_025207 [Lathyrus oleraceus]|uniref:Aminopeptidase N-like N-terminal domain-containing protein n=1 Tax=Pisum sativum TaxID=3888 RepID=A0A9D4YHL8_PEA|nr:hypothetical protein KIW84_025207 [Pisum sativum]
MFPSFTSSIAHVRFTSTTLQNQPSHNHALAHCHEVQLMSSCFATASHHHYPAGNGYGLVLHPLVPVIEQPSLVITNKFSNLQKLKMMKFGSQYKHNGEKRNMAVAQFEPADARRCFPCWDEPACKATFKITLDVPSDPVALSNIPVAEEKLMTISKLFRIKNHQSCQHIWLLSSLVCLITWKIILPTGSKSECIVKSARQTKGNLHLMLLWKLWDYTRITSTLLTPCQNWIQFLLILNLFWCCLKSENASSCTNKVPCIIMGVNAAPTSTQNLAYRGQGLTGSAVNPQYLPSQQNANTRPPQSQGLPGSVANHNIFLPSRIQP